MQCPVCKTVTLAMSEKKGIEIDYCPQCRGVWLDRGELEKIIERSADAAPPPRAEPQAPAYQRQHQHQHQHQHQADQHHDSRHGGHYKKKREGFLSDLFDFD